MPTIQNNIIIEGDTIMYMYKVPAYTTANISKAALELVTKRCYDAIHKINMPGGMYFMPSRITPGVVKKSYEALYSAHGFREMEELAAATIENAIKNADNNKFDWDLYFYVVENRVEMQRGGNFIQKRMKDALKLNYSIAHVMSEAEKTEALIAAQVASELGGVGTVQNETEQLLFDIEFPLFPNTGKEQGIYFDPSAEKMTCHYRDLDLKKQSFEVKHYVINDIKNVTNDTTQGIAQLKRWNIPFALHLQFELVHSKDFLKRMYGQQLSLEKEHKKYKRWFERPNAKLKRKQALTKAIINEVELDESAKIKWQLTIRIVGKDESHLERLEEHMLKKFTARTGLGVSMLPGRQEEGYDNFKPWNMKLSYFQTTNVEFVANLNFLGGEYRGDLSGLSYEQSYATKNTLLKDPYAVLQKKTDKSGILRLIAGTSGSGKSMFQMNEMLEDCIIAGIPFIKINPKNDEEGILEKLPAIQPFAQYVQLGASSTHYGVFDPFKTNKEYSAAITSAKEMIKAICDCYGMTNINMAEVDRAVQQLRNTAESTRNYNTVHLTNLYKLLQQSDNADTRLIGDHMYSAHESEIGKLLFGQDNQTDVIDLSKQMTFITFKGLTIDDKYNPKSVQHVLTKFVLDQSKTLVEKWSNHWIDRAGKIAVDEYAIWKKMGGESTVDYFGRMGRSWKKLLDVLSQGISEFGNKHDETSLANLASSVYIGVLGSTTEINRARDEFHLGEATVRFLEQRLTKTESEQQQRDVPREYPFQKIDENGRMARVEARFNVPGLYNAYDSSMKKVGEITGKSV